MVTIPPVAEMMVAIIEIDPIEVGLEAEDHVATLQIVAGLYARGERVLVVVKAPPF
jgi:hypothetical protein